MLIWINQRHDRDCNALDDHFSIYFEWVDESGHYGILGKRFMLTGEGPRELRRSEGAYPGEQHGAFTSTPTETNGDNPNSSLVQVGGRSMPTLKRARAKPHATPSRSVVEKALLSAGGSAGNSRARKPLDIAFRRVAQDPMALGWQDLLYAVRPGQEPPLQILREVYGPAGKRANVKQAKAKSGKVKK